MTSGFRPVGSATIASAVQSRLLARVSPQLVAVGSVSLAVTLFFALRLPPHGDAPAHLHRTLLVLRGDFLWDNLWFRGNYPLASYSLLYYLVAAVLGNTAVVVGATVATSLLFGTLVSRLWGRDGRWSVWLFAVFACEPLLRAEYPFALGIALLLASLIALQGGRVVAAGVAAAFCLAASPLAFAFLCLAAVGIWSSRPTYGRIAVEFGASLALVALGLGLLSWRFEMPWSGYPFPFGTLIAIVVVSTAGVGLTHFARGPRVLAGVYGAWGLASVIGYVVPSPVGLSFERPSFLLVPLLLIPVAKLAANARRLACAAVLALSPLAAPALVPSVANAFSRHVDDARLWAEAVGFLRPRVSPDYRVEVVPTAAHWEAYYLPKAGIAIARGWYRQLDLAENSVLYRHLTARRYRRWLDANSVQWVVFPRTSSLDAESATAEAKLLATEHSGLRLVWTTASWRFYEVPHATPLLRPKKLAQITALAPDRIAGVVRRAGTYRLDVAYMPYWESPRGVAVRRAPDGTTILRVDRPRRFVLTAAVERVLDLG